MSHIPNLRSLRARAKLSQAELSKLSGVGRDTISKAENNGNARYDRCYAILEAVQLILKGSFQNKIEDEIKNTPTIKVNLQNLPPRRKKIYIERSNDKEENL